MMSHEEFTDEVLCRADIIARRQAAKKRILYSSLAAASCLALIAVLSFAIPSIISDSAYYASAGAYGAMLFGGAAAGGYVLIGVVGFALGAAVTILCFKRVRMKPTEDRPDDRDD